MLWLLQYIKDSPMTTLKALEDSLYWMQVVYKQSTDPTQRERVKARIAKLEAQIEALKLEVAP
jgi:hypothetical protein